MPESGRVVKSYLPYVADLQHCAARWQSGKTDGYSVGKSSRWQFGNTLFTTFYHIPE